MKKRKWSFWGVLLLLFFAGMANGLMDALHFHEAWKYFDNALFWNPNTSWVNKWSIGEGGVPIVGKERFWGSSTVFVSLTDGWHLTKFVWLFFMKSAVVVSLFADMQKYRQWWAVVGVFAIATVAHSIGFHLVYTFIF